MAGFDDAGFDDPAFYGDRWAAIYDEHPATSARLEPTEAVEFLAGLAGGGRVLELAIGTGRVALPLAARGVAVEGVDASQAMVDRLRAKLGGDAIPVTIGDMAKAPVIGPFRLVYLVFNTLFGLLTQARQAECFRSAASRLVPPAPSTSRSTSARDGRPARSMTETVSSTYDECYDRSAR